MTGEVLFWGATGQAKALHEALSGSGYKLVALVDNRQLESPWPGVPILHGIAGLDEWLVNRSGNLPLFGAVAIGGGNGKDRLALMEVLKQRKVEILSVVHRRAFLATDCVVGEGCQILANSAVCSHAHLGRGVIINTSASVDHDCRLGDGVHIGPGACLAGEVEVGSCTFVGTGAAILPRLRIGEGCTVGAGAVVTKDIEAFSTVVGVPARPLKRKE